MVHPFVRRKIMITSARTLMKVNGPEEKDYRSSRNISFLFCPWRGNNGDSGGEEKEKIRGFLQLHRRSLTRIKMKCLLLNFDCQSLQPCPINWSIQISRFFPMLVVTSILKPKCIVFWATKKTRTHWQHVQEFAVEGDKPLSHEDRRETHVYDVRMTENFSSRNPVCWAAGAWIPAVGYGLHGSDPPPSPQPGLETIDNI